MNIALPPLTKSHPPYTYAVLHAAIVLLILLCSVNTVHAEEKMPAWQFGLSMHDMPKYGRNLDYLSYVNPQAKKGGTLRLGEVGSFDSINPYTVLGDRPTSLQLLKESLLGRTWDEPFSLYGLLAESYRMPDDRRWIEFKIRPEAHWNDKKPVTVDDVFYSWQTLKEQGPPNLRLYYSKIAKVDITGINTIRFTALQAERELPMIIGLMPILQKDWWQTRGIGTPSLDIFPTSGPYKLTAIDPGRKLTYTRDQNYWGNALPFMRGQWNFDRITYDYFHDEGVALEAFKAGGYDLRRETDPLKWLNGYNDYKGLREEIPFARPEPLRGFIFNTRRAPFSDEHVRQALLYAFDFDWVNRVLFGNIYTRSNSIYPNSELAAPTLPDEAERKLLEPWKEQLAPNILTTPLTLPNTQGNAQNLRENYRIAHMLLQESGWVSHQGRLQKNGIPFDFEIMIVFPSDKKVALEFARSLKRLGITAHLRLVDSAQYQSRMNDFDFDMVIGSWASTLSPGNEQLYFWGKAAADQSGSRNYAGIKSDAVDALIAPLTMLSSRKEFVTQAHALDRVIMSGHYIIPLFYLGKDLVAYAKGLQHPIQTALYGILPEQTWWWSNPEP